MKDIEPSTPSTEVDPAEPSTVVQHSRRQAIQRLGILGIPEGTEAVHIDMRVNTAFAEPGS